MWIILPQYHGTTYSFADVIVICSALFAKLYAMAGFWYAWQQSIFFIGIYIVYCYCIAAYWSN